MTIWTSKSCAVLGMLVMLGACQDTGTASLLSSLAPPTDAALPPVPLSKALMMRGNVTLVPPSGYCIDPDSLTQSFALMARCDTLGAATGGSGAPVGLLTVSFARTAQNLGLPTAQEIATASGFAAPTDVRENAGSVIFRTSGTAPAPDLAQGHWRSAARIGGFTMGAALFGPENRRAVSEEGAQYLEELIRTTKAKTNAG